MSRPSESILRTLGTLIRYSLSAKFRRNARRVIAAVGTHRADRTDENPYAILDAMADGKRVAEIVAIAC